MSDEPTVSVEEAKDEETGRPVYCFIWEFPPGIAPKMKGESDDPSLITIRGEATWKPKYSVSAKEKTQTLDGAISTWAAPVPPGKDPPDPELVEGANLYLDRKFFNGTVDVEITWTVHATGTDQSYPHTQAVGNTLNATETETKKIEAPRLSTAILADLTSEEEAATKTSEAEPDDEGEAHAYFGGLIHAAIENIHQRLRTGLGRYWRAMGSHCKNGGGDRALSELRGSELDGLSMQQLDETWAQIAAELFVGTCYHGPGSHMGLSKWSEDPGDVHPVHLKDTRFFRGVKTRAEGNEIPADDTATPGSSSEGKEYIVSLCYACQQLSTAALMTRSADYLELGEDPMDCGAPEPHGKLTGKFTHQGDVGNATGVELEENGWLVPGACYFRESSIRHVGIVLRAFQSTQIQLLDTDGWNFNANPFPMPPKTATTYVQINSDTQARTELPRKLFGVLVPPPVDQSTLTEAIKLMHVARPLGVARLVVYRRGSGENKDSVLYVSRKLFMHEGTGEGYRYYSVAALLNSLRGCPHADKLDIRWQIYRPFKDDAVRNACNAGKTSRWWEGTTSANTHSGTMELSVQKGGKPRVHARNCQGYKGDISFHYFLNELEAVTTEAEIAEARKKYKNLADVSNAALPAYFQK